MTQVLIVISRFQATRTFKLFYYPQYHYIILLIYPSPATPSSLGYSGKIALILRSDHLPTVLTVEQLASMVARLEQR